MKATKNLQFQVKLFNPNATALKDGTSNEVIVEGYANTSAKDRVGDVVLPSAFEKSLPTYLKNPVLLENHDWNKICGRVLQAEITDKGLYIKARISDTRPDIKQLVREGCLSTFSIGYNEIDADMDDSTKTKYIKELELLEISVVSVPANTEASFTVADTKIEAPSNEEEKTDDKKSIESSLIKDANKKIKRDFNSFLADVKEALEASDLGEGALIAITNYYISNEDIMTKQELIEALRKKSTTVPAQQEETQKADGEMDPMKMIMEKLDMIAQALAKLMEEEGTEQQEEAAEGEAEPAQDQQSQDQQPKDEQKKDEEDGKEEKSEEEKADALQECVSDKIRKLINEGKDEQQAAAIAYSMCGEGKAELSDEEIEKHLEELTTQIAELDEEMNG